MRLLITGGAGFIGSNFVRKLFLDSYSDISSVTVIDSLTYAGVEANLDGVSSQAGYRFIYGDICDGVLLSKLIPEVDAVLNFAAESHVDRSISNSEEFVRTNVAGVQTLLDTIKNLNQEIRFVQISTDEVYGSIDSGSWNEDSPLLPNSPYSASKAGGELLARAYHKTHGLDVVITRSSNNYGPYHFPEKLIPLFITNLIEGKKVPVYGNGQNVRDWLHVNDHCLGIYAALMNGKSGEVYNLGGGNELSNIEITLLILDAMRADATSIEYVEDRKGHDFRYSIDSTKSYRELGFQPKVRFEDGLQETIEWYRNNPEWWEPLKRNAGL